MDVIKVKDLEELYRDSREHKTNHALIKYEEFEAFIIGKAFPCTCQDVKIIATNGDFPPDEETEKYKTPGL